MRRGQGRAPARVNLIGEHTDYNQGYVLPAALPYFTEVTARPGEGVEAQSDVFGETRARPLGPPAGDWLDYLAGVLWALGEAGYAVPGARFTVRSTVPVGVGLASSAALEVAALKALRALYRLPIEDLELARLAQRAEAEYVGVRCGIMDQVAAALGRPGEALFLDTRNLAYRRLPLLAGTRVAVIDAGLPRRLAESGYNQRRAECAEAARLLGVASLREVEDPEAVETLPEPYRRRARHVVTENRRVLRAVAALKAGDARAFGALMVASHRSLARDFEVSTPELDRLVELALSLGALGAKLTGAGFGGAVVALVPEDAFPAFARKIQAAWPGARVY